MAETKQLFPVFDVPEILNEGTITEPQKYLKSYLFDFDKGDFVTDGANRVQKSDGLTAWAQWCMKAVQTTRFAYLAYSDDMGIEDEEVMKQPTRQAAESVYERTVTEALMVHPGTESVKNFKFTWSGDNLSASFEVYPREGNFIKITAGTTT